MVNGQQFSNAFFLGERSLLEELLRVQGGTNALHVYHAPEKSSSGNFLKNSSGFPP